VIELQGVEQILSCVEPFLAEGAAFIGVSYDRMRISLEPEAASKNFVILPPRRSGTWAPFPVFSIFDCRSFTATPSTTGFQLYTVLFDAATNVSVGGFCKQSRVLAKLEHPVELTTESYEGWYSSSVLYNVDVAEPDWRMAARKRLVEVWPP
jgi:hypothetical protein